MSGPRPRLFWRVPIAATAVILAGCATPDLAPPDATEVITYETQGGAFCGRCDSTKFAITPDGHVRIENGRWDGPDREWRTVRRTAEVTPEQFARFRDLLKPYRPEGVRMFGDEASGDRCVPDQGGAIVTWHGNGPDGRLVWDDGCGPTYPALAKALRQALQALDLRTPALDVARPAKASR